MPGRTRYEVARKLRTEEIGRERRLRGTFVVEGIRAVGGRSGAVSVSVRYFALEGNQVRGARHPSGGRAGSKRNTTGASEARETAEPRQGGKASRHA